MKENQPINGTTELLAAKRSSMIERTTLSSMGANVEAHAPCPASCLDDRAEQVGPEQ